MIKEECLLLTHHVPSNVYYHISKEGVSIENNILKLLGKERIIILIILREAMSLKKFNKIIK